MSLTFEERHDRKMNGRNMRVGFHRKNAHRGAARNLNIFLPSIFLSLRLNGFAFLKS
jgi:hypothetical protein